MEQRPGNQQQWQWDGNAPYQQQYTIPPQPQKPRKHTGRNITLGIVGSVAALVVLGAISSAVKTPATTPTAVTSTAVARHAAAPATSAAAPVTTVVLKTSGSGIKNTADFTTGPDWSIAYTFDCTAFGQAGNFQMFVYDDGTMGDIPVNALASKGSDVTYEHADAGSHYLEMNSECAWTVTVTDGN